jgi:O-acetyl-ADP-ribose deacetylase (regulator of RNase III)
VTGAAAIELVEGDITTLDVDAIVNAANAALAPGGGVCGAIHRAAGPGLAQECAQLLHEYGPCHTGQARLTGGHDLAARYVIHAVGPVWQGGAAGEAELLASCYRAALDLAQAYGVASIAFPAISTGIFGYPPDDAARIAVATVRAAAAAHPAIRRIAFCTFGAEATAAYRAAMAAREGRAAMVRSSSRGKLPPATPAGEAQ